MNKFHRNVVAVEEYQETILIYRSTSRFIWRILYAYLLTAHYPNENNENRSTLLGIGEAPQPETIIDVVFIPHAFLNGDPIAGCSWEHGRMFMRYTKSLREFECTIFHQERMENGSLSKEAEPTRYLPVHSHEYLAEPLAFTKPRTGSHEGSQMREWVERSHLPPNPNPNP
ncbi:hypothetical protein M501DRAFT_1000835, partial [Patellaria atrata CBS 101060]